MTFKYDKVYLNETYTVVGPYEDKGPLGKYFDNSYEDLYCEADSWEKAETKLLEESMKKALRKNKLTKENIDLVISGDLLNQVTSSCYAASKINKPFLGIYSACASNVDQILLTVELLIIVYVVLVHIICLVKNNLEILPNMVHLNLKQLPLQQQVERVL